jgi:hypothetical protein
VEKPVEVVKWKTRTVTVTKTVACPREKVARPTPILFDKCVVDGANLHCIDDARLQSWASDRAAHVVLVKAIEQCQQLEETR